VTIAGLYVGGNIGANDAANCIGASVGARLIRYRSAIIMVAVCVVAGAVLQGGGVMKTVGRGIVTEPIPPLGVFSALLCGGIFVTLATFFKIPVSTSQSVVGAVTGVGLAAGLTVSFSKIFTIAQCWVGCPILSGGLTYLLYQLTRRIMRRELIRRRSYIASRVLTLLVLLSAGYAAYSLGANNLGNAIGPIVALESEELELTYLIGAGAGSMALGALIFGKGVADTVGKNIVPLDLQSAFAVQTSSAFGLHLFSMLGIPVSTSQAIVGALLGVGLVHGIKTVSRRKMLEVVVGWVLTPTLAGGVSFVVYHALVKL
jgi:phosphate/sulfate permease